MTVARFRRDRILRASGYEIATWGVLNGAASIPWWSAVLGQPWPSSAVALVTVAVIALGIVAPPFHRNRAAKLCGDADAAVAVRPAWIWAPVAVAGVVVGIVLVREGEIGRIVPLTITLGGVGHVVWGAFSIPEIRRLGVVLLLVGVLAAASTEARALEPIGLALWSGAMGAGWIGTGAAIHRRYLRLAPPAVRDQPYRTP